MSAADRDRRPDPRLDRVRIVVCGAKPHGGDVDLQPREVSIGKADCPEKRTRTGEQHGQHQGTKQTLHRAPPRLAGLKACATSDLAIMERSGSTAASV